jgi:hypothetical protein
MEPYSFDFKVELSIPCEAVGDKGVEDYAFQ